MDFIISLILLSAAVIHFLPVLGVCGVKTLHQLYGVSLEDQNLIILMRHRAVLFGLVGAFLFYAAFSPEYYKLALSVGIISVGSFIVIALTSNNCNLKIRRTVIIDFILLIGFVFSFFVL